LDRLGPDYRFETRFGAEPVPPGHALARDLDVESSGDPFFIFESAFLVLAELRRAGISSVKGTVRVTGPFLFNWQPDPAGARLENTLSGRDGIEVWPMVTAHRPDLTGVALHSIALRFADERIEPVITAPTVVRYRSPRLKTIMKALNCYSNNVFHPLSDRIGGPKVVERIARERLPADERDELTIDNAAGAGLTNRMSPRVAVSLVRELAREAAEHGLGLADLLPVAGADVGTLHDRIPANAPVGAMVGKTGTYGSIGVSALAGVVHTRDYGEVTFAVLNKGLAVDVARQRQDAFVRAIMSAGGAVQVAYATPSSPLEEMEVETVPRMRNTAAGGD